MHLSSTRAPLSYILNPNTAYHRRCRMHCVALETRGVAAAGPPPRQGRDATEPAPHAAAAVGRRHRGSQRSAAATAARARRRAPPTHRGEFVCAWRAIGLRRASMADPGSYDGGQAEWSGAGANDDQDLFTTPQLPSLDQLFSSQRDGDGFVLKALAGAELPGALGKPVAGELDAAAFAMGALWELAAENGENQARGFAVAAFACALSSKGVALTKPPLAGRRTQSARRAPSRSSCACWRAATTTTCCRRLARAAPPRGAP